MNSNKCFYTFFIIEGMSSFAFCGIFYQNSKIDLLSSHLSPDVEIFNEISSPGTPGHGLWQEIYELVSLVSMLAWFTFSIVP